MSSSGTPCHADPQTASRLTDAVVLQLMEIVRRLDEDRQQQANELREVRQQLQLLQQASTVQLEQEAATQELLWAVCRSNDTSSAAAVAPGLLDRGADVHASVTVSGTRSRPVLHTMISRGMLSTLEAVMAHEQPVDLTVLDASGRSPLHVLASACPGKDEKVADMLAAILGRLRDPERTIVVDWVQVGTCAGDEPLDFLSAVAGQGRLSLLFPELINARVRYYDCRQNFTLELKVVPQPADWARLSDEHKMAFATSKKSVKEGLTGRLAALLESCEWKPQSSAATLQRLKELARLGADVMHLVPRAPGWHWGPIAILSYFIRYGPMEVVECLLQTPHPIDFTVCTQNGSTPLHFVTPEWGGGTKKTLEEVRQLLHLLLDHIEQHPQEDIVDWGRKNKFGDAPISRAAAYGHLAPFVKVVFHERPVPHFTDHPGRITITSRGKSSDVKRLPEADRKRLDFIAGMDETSETTSPSPS